MLHAPRSSACRPACAMRPRGATTRHRSRATLPAPAMPFGFCRRAATSRCTQWRYTGRSPGPGCGCRHRQQPGRARRAPGSPPARTTTSCVARRSWFGPASSAALAWPPHVAPAMTAFPDGRPGHTALARRVPPLRRPPMPGRNGPTNAPARPGSASPGRGPVCAPTQPSTACVRPRTHAGLVAPWPATRPCRAVHRAGPTRARAPPGRGPSNACRRSAGPRQCPAVPAMRRRPG